MRGRHPLCHWLLPHHHDHRWKLPRHLGRYQGQIIEKSPKLVYW